MAELCCLNCKSFKPIELYPSFYYDCDEVGEDELSILNKRRNTEKKTVSKLDSNYNKNNDEWYIINSEWLKDWKMFVNNKRSTTAYGARRSAKKDVGILDPGPVTNHLLLDDEGIPLPNMSKGKNYRGVNKAVWKQLYETYGGGPVLRRTELSIYADDLKDEEMEDIDVSSSAIKKHFKAYAEDEDTQPAVSNEFDD
jgi:hypothetical protein